MTTTYKVKGMFGKHTRIDMVMSEDTLNEYRSQKMFRLDSFEPYSPQVIYKTCEGCSRCEVDEYVPHYNCIYQGKAVGHSESHCTADACY